LAKLPEIAQQSARLALGVQQTGAKKLAECMGAECAAMMPLSQAILLRHFPVEEHALAITTFGIGMMAAPVIGPTVGGWITQTWSWRWHFHINVPAGRVRRINCLCPHARHRLSPRSAKR
jgi:MFS family permease